MKPKVLKFSEHCDKQKHDHAFCADERMTELAFAVSVLLETVMGQRGCSRNVARMYAATLLKGEAVRVLLETEFIRLYEPSTPRCFRIIRFYRVDNRNPRTIKSNVTELEAQAHCGDPRTRKAGVYFDGYDYMRGCRPRG